MCLPLGCTKTIVGITACIILVGGLGSFIVSLAAFTSSNIFAIGAIKDTISTLKYVILFLGIGLFLTGIMGIIGAWKKNSCLLTIYGLITIIFSLAFLVVGIYGLAKTYKSSYITDLEDKVP